MNEYTIVWKIEESGQTPKEAATKIWTKVFGRSMPAGPDEACVFEVTDPEGKTTQVDLSKID